jgi:hypothetical protein
MKSAFRVLALGALLLLPISAAFAQAPTITAINDLTLNANGTMTVSVVAIDVNGDPITLSSTLPSFATLNPPTFGAGVVITTMTLSPSTTDVGTYNGSITATAGGQTDLEEFTITVNAAGTNEVPIVTAPAFQTVTEGQLVTFIVTASDSEAIQLFNAAGLPPGATFTTNVANTSGTFSWTPTTDQEGQYEATFTASNPSGSGSATTLFVVLDLGAGENDCPTITLSQNTLTVVEGQAFSFNVTVSDPDGGNVDLLAPLLPSGATFTDNNNNVGTLSWTPGSTQAGTYAVTFIANDNEGCVRSATLNVVVNEGAGGNECPTITAPATQTVNEGEALSFNVTTSDPDGDAVTVSASGVPSGGNFNTSTGAFTWTPGSTQSGTYTVTFTANDNNGCTQTATTVITVNDVGENNCPTITAPATQTVNEGQALSFNVTTTDPDGDTVTVSASDVPSGANFNTSTGAFTWTPNSTQSGTYTVTFTANDNQGCTRTATTVITVNDVTGGNNCPTITAPATQTVNEGGALSFNVTTSDPDGDTVTVSASGVPSGANFNTSTGAFTWTPGSTQSGTYTVTFTANDNHGCTQTATTVITVTEGTAGNDCPTITAPATRSVNEGQTLTFSVTASDPDGDDVMLTATGVPSGASFDDLDNNSATFTWTPSFSQSGTYSVTFSGNDGEGCTQTATTVITVNDVTQGGTVDATATLSGRFNTHKKFVCFKIHPLNGSFDVENVLVSSIVLRLGGEEAQALSGKTHIAFDCDGDGDDDGDDCDECADDGHVDEGDHDEDCDHEDDDGDGDDGDCVATHVRACFSMESLRDLFGEEDFGDELANATIVGQLSTGQTFVATVDDSRFAGGNNHGKKGNHGLKLKASPNPLNPKTQVSFMLSREGRVRIAIYDLKGRLVKALLDENRGVGANSVLWDGTDSKSGKVASGVYFFKIQAPQGQEVLQLTVLK